MKRKDEMRQKMRIRLLESVQQGNARKKAIQEENLRQLEAEYEKTPSDSLKRKILNIQVKLGMVEKDAIEQLKYNLLNTPDDKLTPSQLNIKRYQKMLFDQAAAKKQKNQEFKKKQEEARKFKLEEPEKYLEVQNQKVQTLLLLVLFILYCIQLYIKIKESQNCQYMYNQTVILVILFIIYKYLQLNLV